MPEEVELLAEKFLMLHTRTTPESIREQSQTSRHDYLLVARRQNEEKSLEYFVEPLYMACG